MNRSKNRFWRFLFWTAAAAVMVFIFLKSAEPGDRSSATSGGFIEMVLTIFSKSFREKSEPERLLLVGQLQPIIRKFAHFGIYTVLGVFLLSAMFTYDCTPILQAGVSWGIGLVYAVTDEIHQIFVPGRAGQVRDVLIDFAGILTGTLILFFIRCLILRKRSRKENVKQ